MPSQFELDYIECCNSNNPINYIKDRINNYSIRWEKVIERGFELNNINDEFLLEFKDFFIDNSLLIIIIVNYASFIKTSTIEELIATKEKKEEYITPKKDGFLWECISYCENLSEEFIMKNYSKLKMLYVYRYNKNLSINILKLEEHRLLENFKEIDTYNKKIDKEKIERIKNYFKLIE